MQISEIPALNHKYAKMGLGNSTIGEPGVLRGLSSTHKWQGLCELTTVVVKLC
jgi:hypothetical protein